MGHSARSPVQRTLRPLSQKTLPGRVSTVRAMNNPDAERRASVKPCNGKAVKKAASLLGLGQLRETFSVDKVLKQMGLANVGIISLKQMFFPCPCHDLYGSVSMNLGDFPELVYHIMILLPMLERKYLTSSRTRAERAFWFMVHNGVTNPELRHPYLLTGRSSGDLSNDYCKTILYLYM